MRGRSFTSSRFGSASSRRHTQYPFLRLLLNIGWESIYAFRGLTTDLSVQTFINVAWTVADLFIVFTFIRYGRRELPKFVSRPLFVAWSIFIFATGYLVQVLFIVEFGWTAAPRYAAFLQNLLMSGLFIAMFVARRGARGQSIVIAVAKWIGTLAPTIVFGALYGSMFILGVGLLCGVFDLAYIGLLLWAGRNPATLAPAALGTEAARSPATSVVP